MAHYCTTGKRPFCFRVNAKTATFLFWIKQILILFTPEEHKRRQFYTKSLRREAAALLNLNNCNKQWVFFGQLETTTAAKRPPP